MAQRRGATPSIPIPPENDAHLARPSTRPPVATADAAARRVFAAIVADAPQTVHDTFFPREPFLVLKGIDDPGGYHDVLLRHFDRDIHALHAEITRRGTPSFDHFQFSSRATWQAIRSEANALPYWAVRHSHIYYRVGGVTADFEVKVFINWGTHWYITHLS
ncbi:MAG: hypothetical protein IPK60_19230 [Sandaracinaceae bacterium]|nr:hypothetical protein [Sandaracinaceae bacterium]